MRWWLIYSCIQALVMTIAISCSQASEIPGKARVFDVCGVEVGGAQAIL